MKMKEIFNSKLKQVKKHKTSYEFIQLSLVAVFIDSQNFVCFSFKLKIIYQPGKVAL